MVWSVNKELFPGQRQLQLRARLIVLNAMFLRLTCKQVRVSFLERSKTLVCNAVCQFIRETGGSTFLLTLENASEARDISCRRHGRVRSMSACNAEHDGALVGALLRCRGNFLLKGSGGPFAYRAGGRPPAELHVISPGSEKATTGSPNHHDHRCQCFTMHLRVGEVKAQSPRFLRIWFRSIRVPTARAFNGPMRLLIDQFNTARDSIAFRMHWVGVWCAKSPEKTFGR